MEKYDAVTAGRRMIECVPRPAKLGVMPSRRTRRGRTGEGGKAIPSLASQPQRGERFVARGARSGSGQMETKAAERCKNLRALRGILKQDRRDKDQVAKPHGGRCSIRPSRLERKRFIDPVIGFKNLLAVKPSHVLGLRLGAFDEPFNAKGAT